jgi:hypothetical protein
VRACGLLWPAWRCRSGGRAHGPTLQRPCARPCGRTRHSRGKNIRARAFPGRAAAAWCARPRAPRPRQFLSKALTKLDLPAPLGAATTKRFPGKSMRAAGWVIRCSGPVRAFARSRLSCPLKCGSAPARLTWSPGCWPRGAAPESKSPGACPTSPPAASSRSISSRCEARRVSSSATSMRMAKAVASVSARSCATSGRCCPRSRPWRRASAPKIASFVAPPAWAPAAWLAQDKVRSCAVRSVSMCARRAPSRSRAALQLLEACLASFSTAGCQCRAGAASLGSAMRSTSATDKPGLGHPVSVMLSCRPLRRCKVCSRCSAKLALPCFQCRRAPPLCRA